MWLASVVSEIDGARDAQGAAATLPAGLFPHTIGSVDTVPLYVQKPVVSRLNTALYSGSKYKHTVLKFQVIGALAVQRYALCGGAAVWAPADCVLVLRCGTCCCAGRLSARRRHTRLVGAASGLCE